MGEADQSYCYNNFYDSSLRLYNVVTILRSIIRLLWSLIYGHIYKDKIANVNEPTEQAQN